MKKFVVPIAALALLLTLIASVNLAGANPLSAQSAPGLEGVRWVLVSYLGADGSVTPAIAGNPATAEFKAGRVSGSTGCNQYAAAYEVGGNTFSIGQSVATRMACAPAYMAQEAAFLQHLEVVRGYWVQDGRLTLHDAQGAVVLTFQAEKTSALSDTPTAATTSTTPVSPTQPLARPARLTLDLSAGFALDPMFLSVQGGGAVDAKTLGKDCTGFVNEQPVVTVKFGGAADRVRAFFLSDGDPTLAVQTPDGKLLCNDNATAKISDPFVELLNPPAGEYRIYVGSAAQNQLIPGILVLTTKATVDLGTFDVSQFVTRPRVPQVEAAPMLLKAAPKAAPPAAARSQPGNMWRVDYYGNRDWAGAPVITEYVGAAAYDWGYGSPSPYLPSDNFTVRLTTDVYFYTAAYTFKILADDEFVLLRDGGVLMDTRGQGKSGQTIALSVSMTEGYHRIEVMYREWTQRAYVDVNWMYASGGGNPPPAQTLPPLPKSEATVKTKYGNFTACRQKGIHQANCFVSDGAWNSPNLGSIQMEPQIQVWRACEPADQVTAYYVSPQTPRREYKCSKSLAGWFPQ